MVAGKDFQSVFVRPIDTGLLRMPDIRKSRRERFAIRRKAGGLYRLRT
jgi:hypothetical protein